MGRHRQFSDEQLIKALEGQPSQKLAARALGVTPAAVCQRLAALRGELTVPPAFVSRRYDAEGQLKGYSTRDALPDVQRASRWAAVQQGFLDALPRAEPRENAPCPPLSGLRAFLPIGDHHFGMLAWKREVGANYDLKLGEELLRRASHRLIHQCSGYADSIVIAVLGDFMHYDSKFPVTQRGGNVLDAEGRYQQMVRTAIRSLRSVVELARAEFASVELLIQPGNHDEFGATFLSEHFAAYYENALEVRVDTTPGYFRYHRYGGNLIGITHGDRTRPAALPGIMAQDQPEAWAATTHRVWWTGHVHTQRHMPFAGCDVETFGILPPGDAWAHTQGYRAKREMKAIVLRERGGEFARFTTTPEELH